MGTLAAGSEKQIKKSGQPMPLNNHGDTIRLINPAGDVVQTVTYGRTEEQETVFPAPCNYV